MRQPAKYFIFFLSMACVFAKESSKKISNKDDFDNGVSDKKSRVLDEEERKLIEPRISNKFYQGEYLIFDCSKLHFACVNKESFKQCHSWRVNGKYFKKRKLSCAPLKKFNNQRDCFSEQKKQIENPKSKVFCRNTEFF